ncbi:MAG TPA: helix-turn-helix domain-containing protein [Bacillus sp. (in: firmicutes)]|nr:helix-turn-helix domain-containing protein [Bacillus sp. (in: firmicutes)]
MDYLSTMILYGLEAFKGERTVYAVYHLLTGKKSAQTIQDGKLYRLSHMFQSFPYLKKESFSQYVKQLKEQNYIEIKKEEKDKWDVTEEGKKYLQEQLRQFPLSPYFNGWRYMNVSASFFIRLNLLVQTLSHLVYNESYFLPVSQDLRVQKWIKHFFKSQYASRNELAKQLFIELCSCLERCLSIEADIFMLQFSGFQRAGLTKKQIGERYGIDEHRVHYVQTSVLHCCLQQIMETPLSYPLLNSLIPEADVSVPLTVSTVKTVNLLQQGKTVEEIMAIRRLKRSTIEDHLVELALFVPDFSIDEYVSESLQKQIVLAIETLKTNKLKEIKENLGEAATYFQVRIVMAKYFS